ncbi:phosphatidylinositol N-acetylglucosaminyltransferase subunit P [Photinus pyralis]|nr:phosphatidylinositol N-acetylglucosaminyltransferase subunit P [Photinus pyralis]
MPEHTPAPTPHRAVYGFALYLSFKVFFVLYVIWAVVPESWFKYLNITCLPQRYWAIAVPIFIITSLLIFGFIIYPSINLCMTPDFNDINTITDETTLQRKISKQLYTITKNSSRDCNCTDSTKCERRQYLKEFKNFNDKCIPSAEDLDISEVSKLLYSKNKHE